MYPNIQYSYVCYADSIEIESKHEAIHDLLKRGIKVILFTNREVNLHAMKAYQNVKLLQINIAEQFIDEEIEVIDGTDRGKVKQIAEHFPLFNIEQYMIEHAPVSENIMVKAGAGTGKTTVMIDRILYLLLKEQIKPEEIVMITFTNEAAANMYKKLRELLFARYSLTKSRKLLNAIESLNAIRIQTIHSFCKQLLKELGSLRGFGLDVQLRSFKVEKKRWIEEELDIILKNELADQNSHIENIIQPLKLFELVEVLYDFSEKFEQKGFSPMEISTADFGQAEEHNEVLNGLIENTIKAVEARFSIEKETINAVTMNDLSRQINQIRSEHGNEVFRYLSSAIKYLFVDEFQDSDDVQIRLIAAIQEAFSATLFVVGDIKQSIYRFRGANHTAFKVLADILSERNIFINDTDYRLLKNYRTTKQLLEQMDYYFTEWGTEGKGYLQYDPQTEALEGMVDGNEEHPLVIESKREDSKTNMKAYVMPYIKARFQKVKELNKEGRGKKKEHLAVLTRTVAEARMVNDWCHDAGLPTKLEVGGSFFASRAVREFVSLVNALLYANEGKYIVNLLSGPYGQYNGYILHELVSENGYSDEAVNRLKRLTTFDFSDYSQRLATLPVLTVLQSIMTERKPFNWVYSRQLDELKAIFSEEYDKEQLEREAFLYTKRYELTIGKLFEMMHQRFSEEFVSLNQIASWLTIQIATNREEDDIVYDGEGGIDYVEIMTAHRAKGLEFHTVIIPFTERPFTSSFSKIIFDKERKKAGWLINKISKGERKNEYYDELNNQEIDESIQEETRLLYVAMTRAEKELVIIRNRKNDMYNQTWSKLLTNNRIGG